MEGTGRAGAEGTSERVPALQGSWVVISIVCARPRPLASTLDIRRENRKAPRRGVALCARVGPSAWSRVVVGAFGAARACDRFNGTASSQGSKSTRRCSSGATPAATADLRFSPRRALCLPRPWCVCAHCMLASMRARAHCCSRSEGCALPTCRATTPAPRHAQQSVAISLTKRPRPSTQLRQAPWNSSSTHATYGGTRRLVLPFSPPLHASVLPSFPSSRNTQPLHFPALERAIPASVGAPPHTCSQGAQASRCPPALKRPCCSPTPSPTLAGAPDTCPFLLQSMALSYHPPPRSVQTSWGMEVVGGEEAGQGECRRASTACRHASEDGCGAGADATADKRVFEAPSSVFTCTAVGERAGLGGGEEQERGYVYRVFANAFGK